MVCLYTAHSASQNSREQANAENIQLCVTKVKDVISNLTEAFYICNMLITYDNTGLVPIGWENQINNLSQDEKEQVSTSYEDIKAEVETQKQKAYSLLGIKTAFLRS